MQLHCTYTYMRLTLIRKGTIVHRGTQLPHVITFKVKQPGHFGPRCLSPCISNFWSCYSVVTLYSHVIRVFLPSQPGSEKHNQEKKSPQTFAHLVNFSKICQPCLIIMQSCYFDYRINKTYTFSLRDLRFMLFTLSPGMTCAKDDRLLFFISIAHKSMRKSNYIASQFEVTH